MFSKHKRRICILCKFGFSSPEFGTRHRYAHCRRFVLELLSEKCEPNRYQNNLPKVPLVNTMTVIQPTAAETRTHNSYVYGTSAIWKIWTCPLLSHSTYHISCENPGEILGRIDGNWVRLFDKKRPSKRSCAVRCILLYFSHMAHRLVNFTGFPGTGGWLADSISSFIACSSLWGRALVSALASSFLHMVDFTFSFWGTKSIPQTAKNY